MQDANRTNSMDLPFAVKKLGRNCRVGKSAGKSRQVMRFRSIEAALRYRRKHRRANFVFHFDTGNGAVRLILEGKESKAATYLPLGGREKGLANPPP